MVYCYHIPSNYTLPWGCIISLDDIGLPATPRIYHNAGECLCSGRQDEILLKQLDNWRTDGAARLMQIDPRCAAMVVIQLIDRWELGTAGWTEGLQGDVETLKSRVARTITSAIGTPATAVPIEQLPTVTTSATKDIPAYDRNLPCTDEERARRHTANYASMTAELFDDANGIPCVEDLIAKADVVAAPTAGISEVGGVLTGVKAEAKLACASYSVCVVRHYVRSLDV
ncbi:hypothetical protein GGS26DRAFT_593841 [Hypomontagnella submonticulosa]|nr:hypothetical protein GGS26DRAFT_593841 [Hypomontagnella submonticulosa]